MLKRNLIQAEKFPFLAWDMNAFLRLHNTQQMMMMMMMMIIIIIISVV
jgi:hypothetical protein